MTLASTSPRRSRLLSTLGFAFSRFNPEGAEPAACAEQPDAFTRRAATAKGRACVKTMTSYRNAMVLAADTVVAIDGEILGKPESFNDALRMLETLNGRCHDVYTGCYLAWPDNGGLGEKCFCGHSRVYFGRWGDNVLAAYAACGESMDKAGAYAVQGRGGFLVERIEGSWSNVVGLPLELLATQLLALDLMRPC